MRPEQAAIKLEEVEANLKETYFAWIGHHDDSVFYYRVHGPVILIEFATSPAWRWSSGLHTRNHIHTMVRTPNGNEFGQALLRRISGGDACRGRPIMSSWPELSGLSTSVNSKEQDVVCPLQSRADQRQHAIPGQVIPVYS